MTAVLPPGQWTRAASLRDLAAGETFDLVVVGGGVIGSAVALDAAARGLRVALVEQKDFAAETSSRSTKLLHGGIRYLPHFQFGLVREGLLEQKILVRTADFLYQPLDFIIPLYRDRGLADLPGWASFPALLPTALRAGLWIYDALGNRPGPSSKRIDDRELLERVPRLRTEGVRGGFVYRDAQTDDARLTLTVLKTAVVRHGAVAVNGVRATRIRRTGAGYVVKMEDRRDDAEFDVVARAVLSATWAFAPPPLDDAGPAVPVTLSKGVHLLFDPDALGLGDEALVLPETDDGRVLFIVPWRGNALYGTTDTPYAGSPGGARAEAEDIDYLMRHLRMYLDVGDITHRASFAGVRALVSEGETDTGRASRAHEIVAIAPGYYQVVGGKLTAYRPIAADAADAVAGHLGVDGKSTTSRELLIGAGVGAGAAENLRPRIEALELPASYADHLVGRYGTEAVVIMEMLDTNPDARTQLGDGYATRAEVEYSILQESAASIADVALRRTHLAWATKDHGRSDAPIICDALAGRFGWDEARRRAELARYEAEIESEGL